MSRGGKVLPDYGEILKDDRCVILTHLIISDKSSEELERQLEELTAKY